MSADRPNWMPGQGDDSADAGKRCQNCGAKVTKRFARVAGDNRDVVHACTDCTDNRHLPREAANAGGGLR